MVDIATPFELPNGQILPNRLVKSAMSEQLGDEDNGPSEGLLRLYRTWAEGGIGLSITGNVMVDPRGRTEASNIIVEDERHLERLRAWAAAAQSQGGKIWMQINHPGRQVPRKVSKHTVAPSPVALKGFGPLFSPPRELTDEEIHGLVARFARTAAIAARAGFDGVQIHGAHGYLISQFLSPKTNLRDDAWGGDRARRMAFLLAIVRAVRAAVGPDFAVGLKLNSADFQRGGITEEDSMAVIEALNAESLDLLEISGASTRAREAYFIDYAEKVRKLAKMPLLLTGGMRSRVFMDEALASGSIDLVGLARPLAVEPDLPARLLDGSASEALPIHLPVGIKMVDAIVQATWWGMQIRRLAEGRPADPKLSRWRAFFKGLFQNFPVGKSAADQPRKPAPAAVA